MLGEPRFALDERTIHIWCVELSASEASENAFWQTLSRAETQRGKNFVTPVLRRRFALSHGVLRVLLGGYLGLAAAEIAFGYKSAGKPFATNSTAIQFNMSHCEDLAAYAFSLSGDVGIDVERLRLLPDFAGLAKFAFAPEECPGLQGRESPDWAPAFFRCWTRKEAIAKAAGLGLAFASPGSVELVPGWQVREFEHRDFTGAIAFAEGERSVEFKAARDAEDLAPISALSVG